QDRARHAARGSRRSPQSIIAGRIERRAQSRSGAAARVPFLRRRGVLIRHALTRLVRLSVLLIVALVALVLVLARTRWGHDRICDALEAKVNEALSGRAQIDSLDGALLHEITLDGVVVFDADGRAAIRARRVTIGYVLKRLWHGQLDHVAVDGAEVRPARSNNGRINLVALLAVKPANEPGLRWSFDELCAEGELIAGASRAHFRVEATKPRDQLFVVRALEVRADGASLARALGVAAPAGGVTAKLDASGALDVLSWRAELRAARGRLALDGVASAIDLRWRATIAGETLDPALLWPRAPHADLMIAATAHGEGAHASFEVAKLAAVSGANHASAHGRFDTDGHGAGAVDLDAPALDALSVGLRGAARGHVEIARDEHTRIDGQLVLRRVAIGGASLAALDGTAHLRDWTGRVLVRGRGLRASGVSLADARLEATGSRRAVRLRLDGSDPRGLALRAAAHGVA